jgi:subtilisin family serine protease
MGLHPLVAQDDLRKINPWILEATADGNLAEFLVVMTEQADLSRAAELKSKDAKGHFVHRTLLSVADRTQASLQQWLVEHRVPHRRFVIFNGFWVLGDRAVALAIAGRKDVSLLEGNPRSYGKATVEETFPALQTAPPLTPELAVTATNAPLVWSLGFHGEGVVIGSQDTGVQWDHPALIASYRGYDGTAVDHSLSWHDSVHFAFLSCGPDNQTPCANDNHGTFTLGLVVGDDGFGNQIGMAPLSRWICARNSEDGIGSPASYIESFEWFLAPYVFGSSSASGDPLLAPDVTNNAWLCEPVYGCTTSTLHLAVMAQRAAGIVTVAAAGNHGPACSTISSPPAIYDEVLTVGGYGASTGVLASFSSRGPVTSDGSGRMKPDLCAPGTAIRSSVTPSLFQAGLNGTSGSCSLVTGAVALLLSAHPDLKGQVDLVEQILLDTATPVPTLSCSSTGTTNNLYGAGILDVWAAVQSVRRFSLSSQPERTGSPGQEVHHVVAIQNSGYLEETVTLSVTGPGGWTCPSSLGPIPPATIAVFSVVVSIPAGATIGQIIQHTVAASSSRVAFANDAIVLTTRVVSAAPALMLSQPTGPSGAIMVRHENLIPGHEYYNVFSFDPCPGGIGTGPWLGLCTASLETLIAQILLPPSAPPIHYVATSTSHEFGPYYLTSGLSVAGVLFDHTGQVLQGVSPVAAYVVQ